MNSVWRRALTCAGVVLLASGCPTRDPSARQASDLGSRDSGDDRSITIIMIGDGMGATHLEAASLFATGTREGLFMQQLPIRAEVATGSITGITDSAASATAMATGAITDNGRVGIDRDGHEVANLIELAHENGLATGVVTTTEVTHATPASFATHVNRRYESEEIARQLASGDGPHVIFGGGASHFHSRSDEANLISDMSDSGYAVARTAYELSELRKGAPERALGLFAGGHLPYVVDREDGDGTPSLVDMSLAAIEILDRNPRGFLLMIEGGRIDHASHANDIERAVHETVEFDDTVTAVARWMSTHPSATLIVTADHECGGLQITEDSPAGELPPVSWRWSHHTNGPVSLYAAGPLSETFDGALVDHRWVHAVAAARILNTQTELPRRVIVPNGYLNDLRGSSASQGLQSNFGVGFNQLEFLTVDADQHGLGIGIEGLFEWQHNAVVVLIDADFGAGTGVRGFDGSLAGLRGEVDSVLNELRLQPPDAIGWGAEAALVTIGGADPKLGQNWDDAGLRMLANAALGDDLDCADAVFNFAGDARVYDQPRTTIRDRGLELFVPWESLLEDGAAESGARFAVITLLVDETGRVVSNQALPAYVDSAEIGEQLPRPLVFEIPGRGENAYPSLRIVR